MLHLLSPVLLNEGSVISQSVTDLLVVMIKDGQADFASGLVNLYGSFARLF